MEKRLTEVVLPAVFLIAVVATCLTTYPQVKGTLGPWYDPVVTKEEVDAAVWVDSNLGKGNLFAADLFACEMLVSAGGQICTIGGAWELADKANQRFYENEQVFMTNSSKTAYDLLKKYGVKYVFTHPRMSFYAYGWKKASGEKFKDATYFTPIFDSNKVMIYKVN